MSDPSELPLFHVVGFSGHRLLEDHEGVGRAIGASLTALRSEVPGEWIALSSVADGSDKAFVAQARRLGLSWHAILPLPKAEFAKDFTPGEWENVEQMLAGAEDLRVITEYGTREDAYLDCGVETVNGADVLMAVWDGQPARGKGGTAEVIDYARALGKPLIIIDASTLQVRRENFPRLERTDESLMRLNSLPAGTTGWGENPFKAPDYVFKFQQKCDQAASKGAPQFRLLIVSTVLLHVLATLVAAISLAFDLHLLPLIWLKLICLLGALGVAMILRHQHHSHHSWVRCRLAAEFCRSALATWGLPRAAPLFADLDLPGVRGLTRALHILHSRSATAQPVPMDEFKAIYLEKRIDDQLSYYRRQEARALPLFKRLKVGFWIVTVLAIVCTAAYALSHTFGIEVPAWATMTIFYFLPISLPVVAASLISFISINDLQRRVARYREMQLMLEESRKQVAFCQTWNSISRVVLKTERALLQEVLEWHSITSFAESH
ncbi:MAG TPA: hypothetical protein VFE25_13080 [Opitutaceae bacterium]|jgi:hypothetical protein|nr:hypothetical protein [Opitutaceae bacterium]